MRQKLRAFFLSLVYARRELRAGIRGFYIFLACLALGVAAIAGVQSLSAGMMDSLRHDGRSILGGDMALRTIYQPATPDQLRFLRHKMGVTTVVMETRAMARTADENRVSLVELKAIDPFYPLYGKVEFSDENGNVLDAKPQDMVLTSWDEAGNETKPWGVAVDKEILTRLGLHVGDMLRIGTQEFQIRGIITREPDRISSQRFSFAPRVMISLYTFDKTGLQEQGNQVYYDHRVHLPYVRTPADMQAAMDKVADAFPDAQWKGRTWYNASPRLERMINRLTQFLTLIGLTTLLVGGVGVSNAVRGFLDGKLANIATFKCLGASGAFVTRVYMTVILMLAALGIAAGLALGAAAALGAGHLLTARLSLTNLVGISPGALGLAAGFGLLTAICFSLWPIARAAGVAPRELFRDMVAGSAKRPPQAPARPAICRQDW